MRKQHVIFDTEIIGSKKPKFFIGCKIVETKQTFVFMTKDVDAFEEMLINPRYTWVGFNSENFDRPLIAAMLMGADDAYIKDLAQDIVGNELQSWETYRKYNLDFAEYDHIDLFNTAPGVQISLKRYAGRLGYPTMVDMPFHHDHDMTPKELKVAIDYCLNDLGVTEALFKALKTEIQQRIDMGAQYDLDLRSKSDAQVAEAILKKVVHIQNGTRGQIPSSVFYAAPDFIKTKSPQLNDIIEQLEQHRFKMNFANGSPLVPDFLAEPIKFGYGSYQMGNGGLHSTHDVNLFIEADDKYVISDFDVASYYPNIMMKAGIFPKLGSVQGQAFIEAYQDIYDRRIAAKRAGDKKIANMLKICLNGTFGKLGNQYCSFYSPELMLAVTISGQLNLLDLIYEIEKTGALVISANTDGIMVKMTHAQREKVLTKIAQNSKRTGFEYEETRYARVGMKDVNNYIAVTSDDVPVIIGEGKIVTAKAGGGKAKRKGLYASNDPEKNPLYLMKNPTMNVCSDMVVDYMISGILPEQSIKKYKRMSDFVACREVKGGGIQYAKYVEVDDWVEVADREWMRQEWLDKALERSSVKRKSRPAPVEVGVGGTPFGRVARWYMTVDDLPPLSYISSGNKVPKTEGARICMTLPSKLPADLNKAWYVQEAYNIMRDLGISV